LIESAFVRVNVIADAPIVSLTSLPRQITTAAIARVRDETARDRLICLLPARAAGPNHGLDGLPDLP
jgi:hypothetical protein